MRSAERKYTVMHLQLQSLMAKDWKARQSVVQKAANQLLDISGIKASFVITEYNEKIYISARSIDEVNVQLVMEKLGGGGHMSIAGAQLTGCTVKEAVDTIKETLDNMLAEGEI